MHCEGDCVNYQPLYAETFSWVYDYHADNLQTVFGLGGVRQFEVRWYPIGIDQNATALTEQWTLAEAGDYVVLDFMRVERGLAPFAERVGAVS